MPEGPEVKVIVDGLNSVLKNKYIYDIEITKNSRYRKKAPNGLSGFKSLLKKKMLKLNKLIVKGSLYILN